MQIAVLGLGKMGGRIAEKLLQEGHEVVAWNRSREVLDKFKVGKEDYVDRGKLRIADEIQGLREMLSKPRVFWLMLPAGEATEGMLSQVANIVEPGDIVVDGGNANFKDTQRHYEELSERGLKFLGIGVSGGIHGLEDGFCLMAGGERQGYEYLRPVFDGLVKPGGAHGYFGTGGAGHFVKMVHNGIEYGMMQAMGEGFGVMAKSPYGLNLVDVGEVWQRGSIVRSFLLDMAVSALSEEKDLAKIDGVIAASGEGKWTVEAGNELGVPVDVIAKSLEFRERSQKEGAVSGSFAAKLVAALRKQFGGHEVKEVEG
jgi:6-phosphogluconate dehydrogenase